MKENTLHTFNSKEKHNSSKKTEAFILCKQLGQIINF